MLLVFSFSVMQFAGRGYACGFVKNGTDSYIIVAGGNEGEDRSQILPLGTYLQTRNVADVGAWTEGPTMPLKMIDAAWERMGESFIMVGGRVKKVKELQFSL